MDAADAPDQGTCCQLWKQSQEELVHLMLKLKEISHKFDIETTRCQTGGGQGACVVHDNGGTSTLLSLKKVMDDLANSVSNLQKEVYRHLVHAHSIVPLRHQRGRTENDRDSAYHSANIATPIAETGEEDTCGEESQAFEHDESGNA